MLSERARPMSAVKDVIQGSIEVLLFHPLRRSLVGPVKGAFGAKDWVASQLARAIVTNLS
jgi:hypothetical protein